jgi:biotin carboxyl carrier protein
MPGTIVAVKTSVGAKVKKGDVLIVLEAMKMENDIVAPQDGVVNQVAVSKGNTVETGSLLVVLG